MPCARLPRELLDHRVRRIVDSLQESIGGELVFFAVAFGVFVVEHFGGDLSRNPGCEMELPLLADALDQAVEDRRGFGGRQPLGAQPLEPLGDLPHPWKQLALPALGQRERGIAESVAIWLPGGRKFVLVGPAELGARFEAAEWCLEFARGGVEPSPHRFEPDAGRERCHLLGVVRRIRQPAAHPVVIGRAWSSQIFVRSKQNSTSSGSPNPRSASRTRASSRSSSSSRSVRRAPATRAWTWPL